MVNPAGTVVPGRCHNQTNIMNMANKILNNDTWCVKPVYRHLDLTAKCSRGVSIKEGGNPVIKPAAYVRPPSASSRYQLKRKPR